MVKSRTALFVASSTLACTLAAGTASLLAGSDEARRVVEESQRRSTSKAERYEGQLQSFAADGKVAEKRWVYERIGSHGQSKSVIRFTMPAEVKGVALLVVNHADKASDQWMWTPSIARDRRIALQDRSTRFFGTDFSFEDLEERDVQQYDYALAGEEPIGGVLCWKIEQTPRQAKSSQYSRSIIWIRKDNYAAVRLDSFVKDGVVRRLEYRDLRSVQNIWTAHELVMSALRRGTRTRLVLDKVKYDVDLSENDFTLVALRR
jgi:hypothetical protein